MPGKAYDPRSSRVLVGTTVTWKNDDSINHTVTADGDAFASGYLPPGGTYTFTFAKQGRYAFHCTIHKFMRGEVDVFGLVLSGPEGPVASGQRSHLRGSRASGHRVGDAPRRADRRSRRACTARRELRRRRRCSHPRALSARSRGASSARPCGWRCGHGVRGARGPATRSRRVRRRHARGRRPCCRRTTATISHGAGSRVAKLDGRLARPASRSPTASIGCMSSSSGRRAGRTACRATVRLVARAT